MRKIFEIRGAAIKLTNAVGVVPIISTVLINVIGLFF